PVLSASPARQRFATLPRSRPGPTPRWGARARRASRPPAASPPWRGACARRTPPTAAAPPPAPATQRGDRRRRSPAQHVQRPPARVVGIGVIVLRVAGVFHSPIPFLGAGWII